jgi:hypothetical protein
MKPQDCELSFGPAARLRKLHANLERATGRDDESVFVVICNPVRLKRSIDRTA